MVAEASVSLRMNPATMLLMRFPGDGSRDERLTGTWSAAQRPLEIAGTAHLWVLGPHTIDAQPVHCLL